MTGRKNRSHLLELNQHARDQGADISDASGPDRVRRIRDAVEGALSNTVMIPASNRADAAAAPATAGKKNGGRTKTPDEEEEEAPASKTVVKVEAPVVVETPKHAVTEEPAKKKIVRKKTEA